MIADYDMRFDNRDEFERKSLAIRIKSLLDNSNGATFFPILVDGDWGAGKTEFLIKLKNYILDCDKDEVPEKVSPYSISYINSFTADYYDDPFMIIVREVYSLLSKNGDGKNLNSFFNIVKKMTPSLIKEGANFTLSVVPSGEAIKEGLEYLSALNEKIKRAEEKAYDDRLKSYLSSTNEFEEFRLILSEAIQKIGGKYILIIDELDRSRPDYSLKLLEMIKHLFDIEGLYVIFGANSKYLEACIMNSYMSSGISIVERNEIINNLSERYLAKFYNLRVNLTAKKEIGVPDHSNVETNYLYYKENYWGSIDLPSVFSNPFVLHRQLEEFLEKYRETGISSSPDPMKRFDNIWPSVYEKFSGSLKFVKKILTALFGEMELRQREKVKQNIMLLHSLNDEVLLHGDMVGKFHLDQRIYNDIDSIKNLLEGPLFLLIGISMLNDKSPLVAKILNSDTFIYRPGNISPDLRGKNSMGMGEISKYLMSKGISSVDIDENLTGFIGKAGSPSFYKKEREISKRRSFTDQEYPLTVLIKTLENLHGLQIK